MPAAVAARPFPHPAPVAGTAGSPADALPLRTVFRADAFEEACASRLGDDADEGKEGEHGGDEDACGASGAERRWRARLRDLNRESEQRHASERNDPYAPVHVGYLIHLYTLPRFSQLEDSSAMPLAPQRL